MDTRDPELKKDLDATLRARGDLGEAYEPALVESFLEKIEERLDGTLERRVRRHLAEERVAAARGSGAPASPLSGFGERFGFVVATLVLAVPLSAIGAAHAGMGGLVVAWLGIFGVNAVHAAREWPFSRSREQASDREG